MWHTAAFWQPDVFTLDPEAAMQVPEIARYIESFFERDGDVALIAEIDGRGAGAAWQRLFAPDAPGYGYVDDTTPEVALAVVDDARGRGIGTALMGALIERARSDGLGALSLSVNAGNPSRRIYQRCGFVDVSSADDAHTMLLRL